MKKIKKIKNKLKCIHTKKEKNHSINFSILKIMGKLGEVKCKCLTEM